MHACRLRTHGSTDDPRVPAAERFWAKVNKTETCWLWTGAISNGYGNFNPGTGRNERAHRWAYVDAHGYIPDGLHLDHLCRTPLCVNPSHLEPVTPRTNAYRGQSPGIIALLTGVCKRGHDLTDAFVANRSDGTVSRRCRVCHLASEKRKRGVSSRSPAGTRDALYERQDGRCPVCGRGLNVRADHVHHRKMRSQGGTWDLANLLLVHDRCHTVVDRSIHQNPARSYAAGHLVHSYDDPALIPVAFLDVCIKKAA